MSQAKLFGLKVREVRKRANKTQEQAAESAKLNPKYLGQIERGEKRPTFEAIISLARALHVSPVVFFQYDPEDADEKTLRKKIDVLLLNATPRQLHRVSAVIKTMLEP